MDTIVQQFLKSHQIAVLGVLQQQNAIHSASLHYAHSEDPLRFYFMTGKSTKKCESLLDGSRQNASLVVGFNNEEFATVQADGSVRMITGEAELEAASKIYIEKYPARGNWKDNPEFVLLEFTPTWWRWRDYKVMPPTEVSSTN